MKVCTDSCIFGAYIHIDKEVNKILDIGTGTGLLTLMLAQRSSHVQIDAVEMEPAAAAQAKENLKESPWNNRLNIYQNRIQEFYPSYQYDLIISNPPFFSNSLESPNQNINTAHHGAALPLDELLESVTRLLKKEGKLWLLLPPYEASVFIKKAELLNLYLDKKINVLDKADSEVIRTIMLFSFTNKNYSEDDFIIKDKEGKYTWQFVNLLKEYYLHLD